MGLCGRPAPAPPAPVTRGMALAMPGRGRAPAGHVEKARTLAPREAEHARPPIASAPNQTRWSRAQAAGIFLVPRDQIKETELTAALEGSRKRFNRVVGFRISGFILGGRLPVPLHARAEWRRPESAHVYQACMSSMRC